MKTIMPQRVIDLGNSDASTVSDKSNRLPKWVGRLDLVQLSLDSLALAVFSAAVYLLIA